MYRLKEQLENNAIVTATNRCLYTYNVGNIIEIQARDLSRRTFVSDVTDFTEVLPFREGLVFSYNHIMMYEDSLGNRTQMGHQLIPYLIEEDSIIVADRNTRPQSLLRMTIEGDVLWKQDIHLSTIRLVHGDRIYYNKIDTSIRIKVIWHILNKVCLKTGENRELINFNDHYYDEVPGANTKDASFYIVAFYDDVVICLVNGLRVVGIDPNTGLIKWEVKDLYDIQGNKMNFFVGGPWQGGISGDLFYILQASIFVCFDLKNKTITALKTELFDLYGNPIRVHTSVLYGDKLYFIFKDGLQHRNSLGVFDINKQKVVWQTTIPLLEHTSALVNLTVRENYIFLNDSEKTLYIFEKSEVAG